MTPNFTITTAQGKYDSDRPSQLIDLAQKLNRDKDCSAIVYANLYYTSGIGWSLHYGYYKHGLRGMWTSQITLPPDKFTVTPVGYIPERGARELIDKIRMQTPKVYDLVKRDNLELGLALDTFLRAIDSFASQYLKETGNAG